MLNIQYKENFVYKNKSFKLKKILLINVIDDHQIDISAEVIYTRNYAHC